MDSMVGYKNERYLYFGRCAAKLDDAADWLPARLSALLLVLASALLGGRPRCLAHLAAGPPEPRQPQQRPDRSRPAPGRLGVQLAGPAYYFGELVGKTHHRRRQCARWTRRIFRRADRLMYGGTSMLALLAFAGPVRLLFLAGWRRWHDAVRIHGGDWAAYQADSRRVNCWIFPPTSAHWGLPEGVTAGHWRAAHRHVAAATRTPAAAPCGRRWPRAEGVPARADPAAATGRRI